MWFWALVAVFAGCLVLQIYFWRWRYRLISSPVAPPEKELPVSVLVCAHHAQELLASNLPALAGQDYPDYEVVLADDGPDERTVAWVSDLKGCSAPIVYLAHKKQSSGKKPALLAAATRASNKWLVLTDADCRPAGSNWLSSLMAHANDKIDLVVGYAPYIRKSGWLNRLIRFEACLNAVQVLSAAACGCAYAAVGRNVACRKALLHPEALRMDLPFGDDDLLVQHYRGKIQTAACIHPESFVYTHAQNTYAAYADQRGRHYAASRHYTYADQIWLIVYFASLAGALFTPLFWIGSGHPILALSAWVARYALIWPVFNAHSRTLREEDLRPWLPLMEILYVCHLALQLPRLFFRRKHW